MLFDLGWSEMVIIFMVVLIVVGPKDLPKVARTIGRWTGKARSMAREFQRSLDDMAREAELDQIKNEIQKARNLDVNQAIRETVDPEGEIDDAFKVSESDTRPAKREKIEAGDGDTPALEHSSSDRSQVGAAASEPAVQSETAKSEPKSAPHSKDQA